MLFERVKSVDLNRDPETPGLRPSLGAAGLTAMGIGAIIGTGIFVLTGIAAATRAGPAITVSFVVGAVVAALAAFCYAEVSTKIPLSGSAYTYTYTTSGELAAWIVGWALIFEYGVGATTVSIGWAGYLANFLQSAFGIALPTMWQHAPVELDAAGRLVFGQGYANVPAAFIILAITALLIKGARESSIVNGVIVVVKVSVVIFFIAVGAGRIQGANWHPYFPFGWFGVMTGASFLFFAYIGFDAISTAAEEAVNPRKDLPVGIIASLAICTVLYIAVGAVLTGVARYNQLNVPSPVAYSLIRLGLNWAGAIISLGALCGLTTTILTMMFGQVRIFYAMSRDGLLPPALGHVHATWRTPYKGTLFSGIVFATVAAFTPIAFVSQMTVMGTLTAFIFVAIALIVLRRRGYRIGAGFEVPLYPALPIAAAVASAVLVAFLTPVTWLVFTLWMIAGLVIYFRYARAHSLLSKAQARVQEH